MPANNNSNSTFFESSHALSTTTKMNGVINGISPIGRSIRKEYCYPSAILTNSGNLSSKPLITNLNNNHHYHHINDTFNIANNTNDNNTCKIIHNNKSYILLDSYGIHEMLASLALMCLLSLLMAFLALFFLQKSGPLLSPEEWKLSSSFVPISATSGHSGANSVNKGAGNSGTTNSNSFSSSSSSSLSSSSLSSSSLSSRIVVNSGEYLRILQISISLSTFTISLNLCCLFVCCIQFLSAVKLLKTPQGIKRTHDFLKKTSHVRITAIGAFLLSIPIFFTGVILFTFINFDEVPALVTSVIIGIGIVFCGIASVQNVYLWQCEKTKASQELSESRLSHLRESGLLPKLELSTLV